MICMLVGMLLRKRKLLDQETAAKLGNICFNLFLPVLCFVNISSIDYSAKFSPKFMIFAFCGVITVASLLLLILGPILKDRAWLAACVHVGFRSNYVMFGVSIALNMFGDAGAQTAAMLIPVSIIPYNMIALILFSIADSSKGDSIGSLAKKSLLNIIKNPMIIASFLGVVVTLAHIPLPVFVNTALRNLGGVASPLSLIVLGAQITLGSVQENARRVVLMCMTRLIFVPLLMVPAAIAIGFRGPELGSLFVLFASPCANSCAIMAMNYNVHPKFTAQVVAMTTMFSGFTIFAGITLLRWMNLF